jgi:hypothetical protein
VVGGIGGIVSHGLQLLRVDWLRLVGRSFGQTFAECSAGRDRLGAGAVVSLAKGFDYEETIIEGGADVCDLFFIIVIGRLGLRNAFSRR